MTKSLSLRRRDFLKAAAGMGTASIMLRVSAPSAHTTPNPNNIVNFGLIGIGTHGCTLLKFLATITSGRCVALCDIYHKTCGWE